MKRHIAIVIAIAIAGLALAGGVVQTTGVSDTISVTDPYARAVPPGQPNSAIFMGLDNGTAQAHALVDAESSVAAVVELHSHTMEDGMMKMRRIERIDIPAAQTVSLEPGGLHLMLIGLKKQLVPDEQVDLTLIFEDGSRTQVIAPVRKVGTGMSEHGKEHKCGSGRCGSGK